jgi:GNAT superfamily N-acetyltransferase
MGSSERLVLGFRSAARRSRRGAFRFRTLLKGGCLKSTLFGVPKRLCGCLGMASKTEGEIQVVRWTDPTLPSCIDVLVSEAVNSGHGWASDFHASWQSRPFTGEGEALFLAAEENQLLAMAAITADPYVDDAATGRLRFIYVRGAARRRGIADRLVRECLALANGRWRVLRLHTDNAIAARLYEGYGFRRHGCDSRATHTMTVAEI